MGFSRQEYWSGLPFPSPEDLPNTGMEPRSPTLQADSLLSQPPWASLIAQLLKNSTAMQETPIRFLGGKDPLEKGKAIHSSILAWRIPWTSPWGRKESDMTKQLSLSWPRLWPILVKVPCQFEKNVNYAFVGWSSLLDIS